MSIICLTELLLKYLERCVQDVVESLPLLCLRVTSSLKDQKLCDESFEVKFMLA